MPIDIKRINWGLRPFHEEAEAFFGVRMIFQSGRLEFLPGRGSEVGEDSQVQSLVGWLKQKGLPLLKKHIETQKWNSTTADVFVYIDGQKRMEASPCASFGYMYISTYVMPKQMEMSV